MAVLSEVGESKDSVFTENFINALTACKSIFRGFIISDQPLNEPARLDSRAWISGG